MRKIIILILILFSNSYIFAQWKLVHESGRSFPHGEIECINENECIAIAGSKGGDQMLVKKSTDGGYTWKNIFFDERELLYEYDEETGDSVYVGSIPPEFNNFECFDYVTPNFVVSGHEEGQITISRDSGYTWDSTNFNTQEDIDHIQFIDENIGYVLTIRSIYKTINSGKDWEKINTTEITNNPNGDKNSLSNFDVIEEGKIVYKIFDRSDTNNKVHRTAYTTDDGKNWNKSATISPYGSWYGLEFLDIQTGWVAGRQNIPGKNKHYKDLIYKTTDSGKTWIKQLVTAKEPEVGIDNIKMFNKNNGIAWGSLGKIWKTTNGGENWIYDKSYPHGDDNKAISFSDLTFPNGDLSKIIAATYHYYIWMYEDPSSVKKRSDSKLKIYPNPAREILKISYEELTGSNIRAVITNSAGMKIIKQDLINIQNGEIDISGLPPGFYFLNIYSGENIINKPFAVVR